jgi:PhoPQ-activated pathogenicity-related protein
MKRTTIFADESLVDALRVVANKERTSLSAVIRRALEEFIEKRQGTGTLPSFLGIGRSGRKDIAEQVEDLLWTAPHPRSRT